MADTEGWRRGAALSDIPADAGWRRRSATRRSRSIASRMRCTPVDLRTYAVKVDGGEVYVRAPVRTCV
jgi:hypothetical protein